MGPTQENIREITQTTSEIQQPTEENDPAAQEAEQEESTNPNQEEQSVSLPNQVPHGMSEEAREQILGEYKPPRAGQSTHFGVVETVYYRSPGMNPIDISTRYTRMLDTDEQVYDRTIRSLEEEKGWIPLDTGWLEGHVGHIVIHNLSTDKGCDILLSMLIDPYKVHTNITDDDVAIAIRIPSKETIRMTPYGVSRLFLKSVKGTAKVRLFVIPE